MSSQVVDIYERLWRLSIATCTVQVDRHIAFLEGELARPFVPCNTPLSQSTRDELLAQIVTRGYEAQRLSALRFFKAKKQQELNDAAAIAGFLWREGGVRNRLVRRGHALDAAMAIATAPQPERYL